MAERNAPAFDSSLWLAWVMASALGWAVGGALLGELGAGVTTGVLQWLVLRQHLQRAVWWAVATGVGWLAGWACLAALLPPPAGVMAGAALGACTGLAQWLVLRQHVHQAGWWIVVSALAWTVGLAGSMGVLLVGAVAGAVTGVALELLLRYPNLRKTK